MRGRTRAPESAPVLYAPSAAAPLVPRVSTRLAIGSPCLYRRLRQSRAERKPKAPSWTESQRAERTSAYTARRGCWMPISRSQGKSEPRASQRAERYLHIAVRAKTAQGRFPDQTGGACGFASRSGNGERVGRVAPPASNTCHRLVSRQLWKIFAISPSCKPAVMACSSGGRT